jgi:uncharacterized repeat protein (TIGR02543 family)
MRQIKAIILAMIVVLLTGCSSEIYTISYETNCNIVLPNNSYHNKDDYTLPEGLERKGYELEGWYLDEDFNQRFDPSVRLKEDTTLFVKWVPIVYEVTFVLFNGEEETVQEYNYGETVPSFTPVKEQYTFEGWYLDPQYRDSYDFDDIVSEDITLYAKWKIVTYTITFTNTNNEIFMTYDQPIGTTIPVPLQPNQSGYLFEGWYLDTQFEEPYNFDTIVHQDVTLYAKWQGLEKSITFKGLDGVIIDTQIYRVGDSLSNVTYPSVLPPVDYELESWSSELPEYMPNENLVIHALFLPIDYSIDGYTSTKIGEIQGSLYRNIVPYDEHDFLMLEGKSVIRFNHLGEIVWRYHAEVSEYLKCFTVDKDNNITVIGSNTSDNPYNFALVLDSNGNVIQRSNLSESNFETITNINIYKNGYLLNVTRNYNERYIAYVDQDFNVIWSTDYDINYPMVFFHIDNTDNITMFFLDAGSWYGVLELDTNGQIQHSEQTSGCSVLCRLDKLVDEYKLIAGTPPSIINIQSNSGYSIGNDSGEYMQINAIIALPSGGYNLYGTSATGNSDDWNNALMWKFDVNLDFTDHEVINIDITKFIDALLTKEGDFLMIASTTSAVGIFDDSENGMNIYYIILKDDDNLIFD